MIIIILGIMIVVGILMIKIVTLKLKDTKYLLANDGVTIMRTYRRDYAIGDYDYVIEEVKCDTEKEYDRLMVIAKKNMEDLKKEKIRLDELERQREAWKSKYRKGV